MCISELSKQPQLKWLSVSIEAFPNLELREAGPGAAARKQERHGWKGISTTWLLSSCGMGLVLKLEPSPLLPPHRARAGWEAWDGGTTQQDAGGRRGMGTPCILTWVGGVGQRHRAAGHGVHGSTPRKGPVSARPTRGLHSLPQQRAIEWSFAKVG